MRTNKFGVRRLVAAFKCADCQRTSLNRIPRGFGGAAFQSADKSAHSKLTTVTRAISRPRANRDVLARGLDRNLPIAAIALRIARVVTEQVLRSQLSRNCRKGLRQRPDVVRTIDLSARSVGELFQITV